MPFFSLQRPRAFSPGRLIRAYSCARRSPCTPRRLLWLEVLQAAEDLVGALALVERVEVKTWHQLGRNELLAESSHVLDAEVDELLLLIVALESLDLLGHGRRDVGLAEAGHALESAVGVERHDAGQDGLRDAGGAALGDEVLEDLHRVEELRDDHVAAGVALLLEVGELLLKVVVGADVDLAVDVDRAHLLGGAHVAAEVRRLVDTVGVALGVA
mmetsp:Transcript_22452/g.49031  ORF Transcript_22452/g.49031 Transcript_22452/m.49031 type:complete len:215 (-) Transcript_22452:548-1192(-)